RVDMPDVQARDLVPDDALVRVEQGGDAEPTGAEPPVVGQGAAQVSGADDGHRPVLGETEFTGDLVDEVVDVVADAAGPVRPEVGEVLAELGGVHPGRGGQVLRGD